MNLKQARKRLAEIRPDIQPELIVSVRHARYGTVAVLDGGRVEIDLATGRASLTDLAEFGP